jgi:hypothetical protein
VDGIIIGVYNIVSIHNGDVSPKNVDEIELAEEGINFRATVSVVKQKKSYSQEAGSTLTS